MSSSKIVSGDYTIESIGGNVIIKGDLIVAGTSSQNTYVDDNIITLNAGETGAGVTKTDAGIEIDRGTLDTVSLIWHENGDGTGKWQFTNDGVFFQDLGSGGGGGGGLNYVHDDTSPSLGGNLNITTHTIYSSTRNVVLSMGTVGSGGTGLYVTNNINTNQELATNKTAITYGIIFG